jgi:methionine synthase II (cobalamin-independent)
VDLGVLAAADHDVLAEALEAGESVALGVVPGTRPATEAGDAQVTERVLRWLDMLGLDLESLGDSLSITPTCGLAGAPSGWSRSALSLVASVARNL